jgi:capsid protein
MLVKYDQSELEAAILNAIFAAYIESPYDSEMVQAAMGKALMTPVWVLIRTAVLNFTMIVG